MPSEIMLRKRFISTGGICYENDICNSRTVFHLHRVFEYKYFSSETNDIFVCIELSEGNTPLASAAWDTVGP